MARKTAAQREAEQQAAAERALAEQMAFQSTEALPWMFQLQEQARKLRLATFVELVEEGVVLKVTFDFDEDPAVVTNHGTERWEFTDLENRMNVLRLELEAREQRRQLAQTTAEALKREHAPEVLALLATMLK